MKIRMRRSTASEWSAADPMLDNGEPGYDTTSGMVKIGTGSADWSALPYLVVPSSPVARPVAQATRSHLFQSGHPWVVTGTLTASNLNDTSAGNPCYGTQCITFSVNGTGSFGGIKLIGDTAFDLSSSAIRITFRKPSNTGAKGLYIYVGDSNLANYYTAKVDAVDAPAIPLVPEGQWYTVTVGLSDFISGTGTRTFANGVVTGSLAGLTDWRIQAVSDNTGTEMSYAIQAVEVIPCTSPGAVVVSFDDTWRTQYDALAYLQSKGATATLYTIAELTDPTYTATRFGLSDLAALQASGMEIGGHAYTLARHNAGLTSYTSDEVEAELRNLLAWQVTNGFPSRSFAYPLGVFDQTTDGVPVRDIVRRWYGTARTITPNPVQGHQPPAMPYDLPARSGISSAGTTVASLIATGGALDKAAAGGVFRACFHEIDTVSTSNQCSLADFQTFVDACVTRGLPIVSEAELQRRWPV
jgi:hypothetical protein